MAHVERPSIDVILVFAHAPHQLETESLRLTAGATVADACAASGVFQRLGLPAGPESQAGLRLALWGRLCGPDALLQAGDRLELLRPLQADPMEARRQRLRREGLRKVQRSSRKAPREA